MFVCKISTLSVPMIFLCIGFQCWLQVGVYSLGERCPGGESLVFSARLCVWCLHLQSLYHQYVGIMTVNFFSGLDS